MAQFEVFVPAAKPGAPHLTLRLQADNWLAALNAGLTKLGESDTSGINVLVDIQDDSSIHVTDPRSGRVFRIQEQSAAAPPAAIAASHPPAPPPPDPFDPLPAGPIPLTQEPPAAPLPAPQAATLVDPQPPPARPSTNKGLPRAFKSRKPSSTFEHMEAVEGPADPGQAKTFIGRTVDKNAAADQAEVLAELFEKVQTLEEQADPEQAMQFLLDLALEKIDAESGSVFLADLSSKDLTVSSARGPKSRDLLQMKPRVPMGVGIVGYCAQEGIALAISDAQRDARFFRAISDRLGYETRSILCTPMLLNGRSFGCMEVMNKKGNNRFEQRELAILSYLSQQAARYLESVG